MIPSKGRIHECTISLSFRGLTLRVLKLEVTNQFQTTFARGGGGGGGLKSVVEVTVTSKEDFCLNYVHEFGLRFCLFLRHLF
jgi:hypothetical protein